MLGRLDDALYDLADKSASNRLYTIYFDALRIIRKQSHSIQSNFLRQIRQGAETTASGLLECDLRTDSSPLNQDLALMQHAELEEVLAINNSVSKAESRYRRELLEMNTHLARLLDRQEVDMRSNPYGPFAICDAFRTALQAARDLEPQIKLVTYKTFDKQVMDRLGGFYGRCVELAVDGGHVRGSGLAHLIRGDTGVRGPAVATTPAQPAPAGPIPQSVTMPFETLQALLERQAAEGEAPASDRVTLPTEELFALLNNLGVRALAEGDSSSTPVRQRISSALAAPAQAGRTLGRRDEATLDLVFLFFEHLLQGNDLPAAIKALIGRMQIPVAKLALLDKAFFTEQGHPARRLLNHIGEAAVGWSEGDERGPDSLYGMIERVVERLILDFDGDPSLFAQMDRFFVAFIAHEGAQSRETEARALAELHTAAPDSDQRAAESALESVMARFPLIPPVVDTILHQGWLPVLLAIYRSDGPDSAAWRSALELAERLVWSVQPKTDAEERRQLLRRIPEILRGLRARLTVSGCDQRQLARWFKDLQTLHLGVVQGDAESGLPAAAPVASGIRRETSPGQRLVLGTWIELTRDDGTKARLKLAWHSPDGQELLFLDRRGQRGPDIARAELDGLRARGLVEILGPMREPIADRALRSVLDRLQP